MRKSSTIFLLFLWEIRVPSLALDIGRRPAPVQSLPALQQWVREQMPAGQGDLIFLFRSVLCQNICIPVFCIQSHKCLGVLCFCCDLNLLTARKNKKAKEDEKKGSREPGIWNKFFSRDKIASGSGEKKIKCKLTYSSAEISIPAFDSPEKPKREPGAGLALPAKPAGRPAIPKARPGPVWAFGPPVQISWKNRNKIFYKKWKKYFLTFSKFSQGDTNLN